MEQDEWPSGKGADGRAAGPILDHAREIIEEELLRRTRADCTAAWLFFLRRQSPNAYNAKDLYNFNYASQIAEVITGLILEKSLKSSANALDTTNDFVSKFPAQRIVPDSRHR